MIEPVGLRLTPPPRAIRPKLAAQMMLGGGQAQSGWLILGFGSVFFWLLGWQADLSGWRFQPAQVSQVQGESLGCGRTRYSEGGTEYRKGTPILQTRYRYRVQGREFDGIAYAPARCFPGGPVTVEYLTQTPQIARIAGMRRQPLDAWTILVALIPGFGLAWVIVSMGRGRNRVRLLREGLPAAGKLILKTPTNTRVMGRRVYRMTFEYTAQSGMAGRTMLRSNMPAKLESAARELVLYDPQNLANSLVLANVPGKVDIDDQGAPVAGGSAAFLVLPALIIFGNAGYVLTLFGSG
jgi:hypothetical protein